MDPTEELVRRICKKYERVTGRPQIAFSDIVNILTGPDMIDLMSELIELQKNKDLT